MHNIQHFSYPMMVNKKHVKQELDEYVAHEDWQEGCTGLYHDIRWLGNKVYPNREAAEKAIEELDRGNYDQIAVLYYSAMPFTDAKRKELEEKQVKAYDEYNKRQFNVYPKTLSSAFLGCKNCQSRLAVKFLRNNKCPVCNNDLRPEYILKSVAAAKTKWEAACKRTQEYIDKHAKKEVRWLVKIEYHT